MARVSKVTGKKSRKVSGPKPTPAAAKAQIRREMLASLALPLKGREAELDIGKYSILIYGPPGIGKTEALASFPDVLFAATEPGTMGLSGIHEFNAENGGVTDWYIMRAMVEMLEAEPDRYKSVVVDTAEEAYEQCMDYVCEQEKIPHPSEGDGGRGWRSVRKEFTSIIQRIKQSGRAIHFTSHSKQIEVAERNGNKYSRVVPTMTGQARSIIEPLVAFIWYMDYMRSTDRGDVSRVIFTQGDDFVTAKVHSVGENSHFPRLLPAIHGGIYELLVAAANGDDVGLDPGTLMPTKRTMSAVSKYMGKTKSEALKKQLGARRVTRGG